LVFLTALTIVFDGIDNQLLGRGHSIDHAGVVGSPSGFSPVVSIGYAGMMIGGALAGLAGDRFGRRSALLVSMALFGLMTAAGAGAASPFHLALVRLLAGAGLGGAVPNAAALAAEYVPLRHRPVAVTLTIVCVPVGATIAGLLGIRALPLVGWRTLFVIGGVIPMLGALALAWVLPESPRYLARYPRRWPELVRTLTRMGHQTPEARRSSIRSNGRQHVSRSARCSSRRCASTRSRCSRHFSRACWPSTLASVG
jgi:AAHS family 4-hydroxybenzoate transporter-like MFS transporter